MCPYLYYEIMRKSKDPSYIRYQMVLSAKELGIKPTARLFRTTAKTVRKWLRRFEKDGWEGLKDQSRALNILGGKSSQNSVCRSLP